jgi:ubiquinone/menaquinone biosynthesis C-methylase UbiE
MAPNPDQLPFLKRLQVLFMRFFFRLLYHQMAWTYDLVAAVVSIGRWRKWIQAVLPYTGEGRILEIGHGPGHLQAELRRQGKQVFGLDASPQMGRQAYHRIRRMKGKPHLVNGYAQFLPFQDSSFDSAIATFPSEYISSPQTIAEVYRILVPGGAFTILPLAWITGSSLPDRLARSLFRITSQTPTEDVEQMSSIIKEHFPVSPFEVSTEVVHLPGSSLLLIHASKPALPQ